MLQKRRLAAVAMFIAVLLAITAAPCLAQESDDATKDLVELKLTDNTKVIGEIVDEAQDSLTVRTTAGVEMKIPRSAIASMRKATGQVHGGKYMREDPNYARLLFAPTGRPLKKGQGYVTDTYILLPGVAYGFTDQISVLAGFSIVPGLDFNDQILYVVPKIGFEISDKAAVAAGALYVSFWDEAAAGIVYGIGTLGAHDRSLHAGIGLGFTKESGHDFEFANRPVFLIGGNLRLSNSFALVGESWPIPSTDIGETIVPVGIAARFIGDNLAIDLGVVLERHVIAEGFPIPWLSMAYNFGN